MGVPSGILTAAGLTAASVLVEFGASTEATGFVVACAVSEPSDWVEVGGLAVEACRVSELCDCCTSCAATLLQFKRCKGAKGSSKNASRAEVKRFILCNGLPVGIELTTPWVQARCRREGFGK